MAEYLVNSSELQTLANAIRAKSNTTDPLVYPTGFVSAIESISSGGGSEATGVVLGYIDAVSVTASANSVSLSWSDPSNLGSDETDPSWESTTVVYKQGSQPPVSLTDGTIAIVNSTRDQFKSTPYVLGGLDENQTYSFTWFITTAGLSSKSIGMTKAVITKKVKTLSYTGTAEALSQKRAYLTGVSIGNYALFAGGANGSLTCDTAEAYDPEMTHLVATRLSLGRSFLTSVSNGHYALVAGGNSKASSTADSVTQALVDVYDENLTHTKGTSLKASSFNGMATFNGKYMIFAGGSAYTKGSNTARSSVVTAYDENLTRSVPTALSAAREQGRGAGAGEYAIFATGSDIGYVLVAEAYDRTLTRTLAPEISVGRIQACSMTLGQHALFLGGSSSNRGVSTVDIYDENLVHTNIDPLSVRRGRSAAATNGSVGIVTGGSGDVVNSSASPDATVDIYDVNLSHTVTDDLSGARYGCAAAAAGDTLLVAGGYPYTTAGTVVDVYQMK